jgi:serine/threonine-protein kinase
MLTPGTILGERYEIIEKIGAGGMSIVYKAKCNKLHRFVAVKVLREEFVTDETFVKKFRAEALSAASLSHPNIVGIYDVGADQDLYYIVMEYVEGKTLKDVIEKESPMSWEVVIEYGMQILSAIKHAHKKQIIHRDIKPQNILVTQDSVLKVTDFGIARAVDSSTVVATGNAIGSVHYFSPEQAKGKYVNETSDLYSCGIVLFEMGTKKLPFEADSHVSIALKHINEEIPRPTSFNPKLVKPLEQIILKATNKKQEYRYQSADKMLEDMKKVLSNPLISLEEEKSMEDTILLSEEQTNQIRQAHKEIESVQYEAGVEEAFEEDEEEISPLYKILAAVGGVLATLVLAGIVSAMFFFSANNDEKAKFISVPDLQGRTLEEAEGIAGEYRLVIVLGGERETIDFEPGTIIEQSPGTQEKIKQGETIQVILAKAVEEVEEGPKEVIVPDVIEYGSSEAQRILDSNGLFVRIEREYHDTLEQGKVIRQNPEAGERALEGDVVILTVSNGPEIVLVSVPNLVTLTQDQARVSLENQGLKLGNITERESDEAEGTILTQGTRANELVERGSAIDVSISIGKQETGNEEPVIEDPNSYNPGEESNAQITKAFTINLPQGMDKESYQVMIIFQSNAGARTVFDKTLKKDEFPYTAQLKGEGEGVIVTYFDAIAVYSDPFHFN